MFKNLSKRDKRAVLLVAITAALIAFWQITLPLVESWQNVKQQRNMLRQKFDTLVSLSSKSEQSRLQSLWLMVPVVQMPQDPARQGILFRDELTSELQRCGIQAKTLQLREAKNNLKRDGYRVLTLECQGQCSSVSMLRLLEQLKQNPYYVAVEKLSLKADSRDRSLVTFQLIVSTYAKG